MSTNKILLIFNRMAGTFWAKQTERTRHSLLLFSPEWSSGPMKLLRP